MGIGVCPECGWGVEDTHYQDNGFPLFGEGSVRYYYYCCFGDDREYY